MTSFTHIGHRGKKKKNRNCLSSSLQVLLRSFWVTSLLAKTKNLGYQNKRERDLPFSTSFTH